MLEHIGRIDNQVKLRGFRVELGEVESAVLKLEGVRQAVAVVKDDRLVLYYTCEAVAKPREGRARPSAASGCRPRLGSRPRPRQSAALPYYDLHNDIAAALRGQLPEYMVPSVFVRLEAMPVNGSGKIDRKALPDPAIASSEHVAPATERERIALERAKVLLGIDDLGVTDDLLRLGLDSIRAMKLAFGLPPEWGIRVSDVVGAGTIRGMLVEKHDVLWFQEKYDPAKKTVVVVHGQVVNSDLSALKDELSRMFNVITIECIFDTLLSQSDIDTLVSPDGYSEFIRLYVQRLRKLLPEGVVLSLFIGFSLGGMMAYDTACEWQKLTGQEPVLMMGDSYLNLSTDERDYTAPAATYAKWRDSLRGVCGSVDAEGQIDFWDELRLAIRGKKKSMPNYRGRAILLRARHGHKIDIEILNAIRGSFLHKVARWLSRRFHIREFLVSPKADIGILELGHRREQRDNSAGWKHFKPDLEQIDVDTTHLGLFRDRDLLPQLVKHILAAL